MSAATEKKIRLVLLGGGHTNTQVIKHIGNTNLDLNDNDSKIMENVEFILVSDYNTSLYSGMCPGGVALQYTEPQFSVDLPQCCHKLKWQFICKKIIEINDKKNILIADDGTQIKYDILSIDIGSTNLGLTQYEGVKDYAISTRPLKLLMDKINKSESQLLNKLKLKFINNLNITDKINKIITINIITVGGGCAGCELIMGLTHRLNTKINKFIIENNLNINQKEKIKIKIKSTLITNSQEILIRDPKALQFAVLQAMKSKNIEIIRKHKVIKLDGDNVYLLNSMNNKESKMKYDICLWATGATSHNINTNNIGKTERGWFKMNNYLQSITHKNIFGAGDCIEIKQYPDTPKSGVYAVREGPILIHNLKEYLKGRYKYKEYIPQSDFLRLLNSGDGKGIGCKYDISFKGAWVWKLKDWIDISWMNKFNVNNLLKNDDKHFKPKIIDIEEEKKEEIDSIDNAVKLLMINDSVDNCNGFALQWKILVKMHNDKEFCHKVVKLFKELNQ